MSQTIHKFPIVVGGPTHLTLPDCAQFLSAQFQRDALCLWVLLDPATRCDCESCTAMRTYAYSLTCCPKKLSHGAGCCCGFSTAGAPLEERETAPTTNYVQAVHGCPVCNGAGKISRPPWVGGDVGEWTSADSDLYPCNACAGSGVMWSPAAKTTVTIYSPDTERVSELEARLELSARALEAARQVLTDDDAVVAAIALPDAAYFAAARKYERSAIALRSALSALDATTPPKE